MKLEASRMGLIFPKSNLPKSKLIGQWQQFYNTLERQEDLESLVFDVTKPLEADSDPDEFDLFSDFNPSDTSDSDENSLAAYESLPGLANNAFGQLGTPYSALVDSMFAGAHTAPLPQAAGSSMAHMYTQAIQ